MSKGRSRQQFDKLSFHHFNLFCKKFIRIKEFRNKINTRFSSRALQKKKKNGFSIPFGKRAVSVTKIQVAPEYVTDYLGILLHITGTKYYGLKKIIIFQRGKFSQKVKTQLG